LIPRCRRPAGCTFTGFSTSDDAGWLIDQGAFVTFDLCDFKGNEAAPHANSSISVATAGPAFGLRSKTTGQQSDTAVSMPSHALLMGTRFVDNAPTATGDISAEEGCRVYSDLGPSGYPRVLDRGSRKLVDAWKLSEKAEGEWAAPQGAEAFSVMHFATGAENEFHEQVQVRCSGQYLRPFPCKY
jgi:hypothetical protein